MARVGLMLVTVRDDCDRDLAGTLRAVAALGYEGVELFDLHGHDAATVRGWLDELELGVAGRHVGLDTLETRLPEFAAECAEIGTDRVVLSWIDPPPDGAAAMRTAERLGELAAEAARVGLALGFHNHDGDVRPLDGVGTFLDELLARGDVFLEVDLGWAWTGGADPVALLDRARGRCPLVHVKDFAGPEFRPVGDGEVPYDRILPAAVEAGVEWLLVEQDETDGPALDAVARSLAAVRAIV